MLEKARKNAHIQSAIDRPSTIEPRGLRQSEWTPASSAGTVNGGDQCPVPEGLRNEEMSIRVMAKLTPVTQTIQARTIVLR